MIEAKWLWCKLYGIHHSMVMIKMKKSALLILLSVSLCAGVSYAASFDCAKAKSFAEKTICTNPQLSKDDDDLKYLYGNAKAYTQDRKAFSEITKALWDSRERCSDLKCVDEWYDTAFAIYGAIKETGIPESNGANDILKNEGATKPSEITEKPDEITTPSAKKHKESKRDFSLYDSKKRAAPVEHNAILYKDTPEAFEFIDTLVGFVRQSSYKCDSVSSFIPMVSSNGFTLACNKFSYKYEIKNNGGNVSVSVDN
ncbi:lysozyme inhibitor LprI family protein [Klebsiella grimontii]|uniref:lysozyme inhibitor LprI family protein n=1 Tax=Klebsiella grimontii TaxID=2058152 RepID=UPI001CC91DD8|nr:hypothetical protein [Klebsiella grimontii]MBZ7566645.1 hypothetical protein [Klebsiella grimontii]MDU2494367.1 hypothetical protein [Klebsiella grimontii]